MGYGFELRGRVAISHELAGDYIGLHGGLFCGWVFTFSPSEKAS